MLKRSLIVGISLLLSSATGMAQEPSQPMVFGASTVCSDGENGESSCGCHSYNPIGLMGDHHHAKGHWMASYRFMHMKSSGYLAGGDEVTQAQALSRFMAVPTEMTMNMHMLGLMYGATDNLTLSAMVPYLQKKMSAVNRMGTTGSMSTSGLGDMTLGATYYVPLEEAGDLHLNLGLKLPTGSHEKEVRMLNGMVMQGPYGMQLGSGVWGINPKLTWSKDLDERWRIGAQTGYLMRVGENSRGWRLGNEWDSSFFASVEVSEGFALSGRLRYLDVGALRGVDPMSAVMPTLPANVNNYGGHNLDFALGASISGKPGTGFEGHRLAAEFALPLSQYRNGVQMKKEYELTLGWQMNW